MTDDDDVGVCLDLNLKSSVVGTSRTGESAMTGIQGNDTIPQRPSLAGLWVPLVTPFTPDAAHVDHAAVDHLARRALDRGATGLVALGTTGEAASLDPDEKHAVVRTCARACADHGAPLIVGIGTNDTRRAEAELAALPDTIGSHPAAALVPVPYYTRPSEAGVVAHFARLAAVSPVPLIVYHIPYRTGRALSAGTLGELAALPGITGIKHAPGGIDQDTVEFLARADADFAVLAGDDLYCSPLLAMGAAGGILASAHVATGAYADLVRLWADDAAAPARALGHRLAPLSAALFAEPNPVVLKGVLAELGEIPSAAVRLPLLPASPASVDAALRALHGIEAPVGAR